MPVRWWLSLVWDPGFRALPVPDSVWAGRWYGRSPGVTRAGTCPQLGGVFSDGWLQIPWNLGVSDPLVVGAGSWALWWARPAFGVAVVSVGSMATGWLEDGSVFPPR